MIWLDRKLVESKSWTNFVAPTPKQKQRLPFITDRDLDVSNDPPFLAVLNNVLYLVHYSIRLRLP